MLIICVVISLLCFSEAKSVGTYKPDGQPTAPNPDVGLRVPELVTKYGYPVESHVVITPDEYILTMHRIPHGKNATSGPRKQKKVVFLMHGLLCSSADWVLMGPTKGLAYLLADLGYDVWMGNARGNFYSRKHAKLNPNLDNDFWLFSWHEIGYYDLPTMIDYTLKHTGRDQLKYIGHSQGTTSFFVMTSMRPEYNEKINVMVALAPIAYMEHMPNIAVHLIAKLESSITWVTNFLGAYEFLPSSALMQLVGQLTCNDHSMFQPICSNILFLIAGYDSEELNATMIPVILSNTPAGSATRQLLHYAQGINSGKFRQFDFGASENVKRYGSAEPPEYDTAKIEAPVILYYGNNDQMSAEIDVEKLRGELPDAVLKYRVPHKKWSHLDFLWGTDVVELLYNHVFDMLERF